MAISPQKKVGIIIIALLLLGAVALVQTGKIQIPGLKSDALQAGTSPVIASISPTSGPVGTVVTVLVTGIIEGMNDGRFDNEWLPFTYTGTITDIYERARQVSPYTFVVPSGANPGTHNIWVNGIETASPSNTMTFNVISGEVTAPTITNISFNQLKAGDTIDFTVLGSGFSKSNDVIITEPDANIVTYSMGIFDDGSDGSSIHVVAPQIFMKDGEYTLQVKKSDGTRSNTITFRVNQTVPEVITNSCSLAPLTADFCKDGKIVDGGKDKLGCDLPPTCAPKASLTANGVSELNLPLGTTLSYKWTSSSNTVSATSTYTTNKTTCSDKGVLSGTWVANTLNGSIASHILPSKYLGCSYTITFTVKDASGNTDSSVLKLNIVDPPAPTATLKVNGNTGSVTAHTGDRVRYAWSSDYANTATSSFTTNKASCGAGGNWLINKPNGALVSPPLPASYAGCVFTLNFTVSQAVTGKKVTSTVVMTVQ